MTPSLPGLRPVSLFTEPSQTNEDFPDVLTIKLFTFVEHIIGVTDVIFVTSGASVKLK